MSTILLLTGKSGLAGAGVAVDQVGAVAAVLARVGQAFVKVVGAMVA
jgi:hypothetical protein